jgi:hypothetical protein
VINDKEVFALLEQFGDELVADIDKSLQSKGFGAKTNSGNSQSTGIIGSTTFDINTGGGGLTMSFYMNDYWYWLEFGRGVTKASKTKKPFKDTLAGKLFENGWDVQKNINAKEWYKEKLIKNSKSKKLKEGKHDDFRKMFVKFVAHRIHINGYKATHFLTEVLNDGRSEKLSEKLSELIGKKIVIDVYNDFLKAVEVRKNQFKQ